VGGSILGWPLCGSVVTQLERCGGGWASKVDAWASLGVWFIDWSCGASVVGPVEMVGAISLLLFVTVGQVTLRVEHRIELGLVELFLELSDFWLVSGSELEARCWLVELGGVVGASVVGPVELVGALNLLLFVTIGQVTLGVEH
jgi:hypothetical protein